MALAGTALKVALFNASVALALPPAVAAERAIRWEEDVVPAVKRAFCVREASGAPQITMQDCAARAEDAVLDEITSSVRAGCGPIIWYLSSKLKEQAPQASGAASGPASAGSGPANGSATGPASGPASAASGPAGALDGELKNRLLHDDAFVEFVLVRVGGVLADHGLSCAGCPRVPAVRQVRLEDVVPYASLLAWPDRVANGSISMHVCSAANGLVGLPKPDLTLAAAAMSSVSKNEWAIRRMRLALAAARSVPEYRQAQSVDEKLALLRAGVERALLGDPEFRSAVGNGLLKVGRVAGVRCVDCVETPVPAVPESEPAVRLPMGSLEEALQRLAPAEVEALRSRVQDLPLSINGTMSVKGYLDLIAAASGTKFELEDAGRGSWRGIQVSKWRTSAHTALVWLHAACGLRFSVNANGQFAVRVEGGDAGVPRCRPGDPPISPQ